MFDRHVKEINKDLEKTGKAIIALGCSFVMGQGAVNDELYVDYKWTSKGLGYPLQIQIEDNEKKKFLQKYPIVEPGPDDGLDFKFMEYENAFVNVLCKKYLQGEYTPINLGARGCGNRATIKELYFYPELRWDLIKETIVIYCPSGMERFDFINDQWPEHFHWKSMWPAVSEEDWSNPRNLLWQGYAKTLHSGKFEVLEQIAHVQELLLWCKLNNAKLIITPGFDRKYTREHFETELKTNITRDMIGNLEKQSNNFFNFTNDKKLADLFPWENMFKPDGHNTFADLSMSKEETLVDRLDYFFQFQNIGSPNYWITPCSHPGAKAHDLFASLLYKHIKII